MLIKSHRRFLNLKPSDMRVMEECNQYEQSNGKRCFKMAAVRTRTALFPPELLQLVGNSGWSCVSVFIYRRFGTSCYFISLVNQSTVLLEGFSLHVSGSYSTLQTAAVIKVKVKLSRDKSWRLRRGMRGWTSILTLKFGTTRTAELSALRGSHTLPPRKFLGTHFC